MDGHANFGPELLALLPHLLMRHVPSVDDVGVVCQIVASDCDFAGDNGMCYGARIAEHIDELAIRVPACQFGHEFQRKWVFVAKPPGDRPVFFDH